MKTTTKLTEEKLGIFLTMYAEGKTDTAIAKVVNVSRCTIANWRKKYNLKSTFDYTKISKIDYNKFEQLFNLNYSDYKIAKELNMNPGSIFSHRKLHNFKREKLQINKPLILSFNDMSILLGTLLGDSSLTISDACINPKFTCAHGPKQKEYAQFKTNLLAHLDATCKYHKRKTIDKRTNMFYEDYTISIRTNKSFLPLYKSFYKNNVKVIPFNLFEYFTAQSLALLFMDDGCRTGKNYTIATMCFSSEDLLQFQIFLKDKFNIETSITKRKLLYIKAKSRTVFEKLITPYFCDSMLYKLHSHVTP